MICLVETTGEKDCSDMIHVTGFKEVPEIFQVTSVRLNGLWGLTGEESIE